MTDVLFAALAVPLGLVTGAIFLAALRGFITRLDKRPRLEAGPLVLTRPAYKSTTTSGKGILQAASSVRRNLFGQALEHKSRGDYVTAVRLLATLLSWGPPPSERAQAHLEMGDCFAEQSDHRQAETHYREAYAIAVAERLIDTEAAALLKIGSILDDQARLDEAEAFLTRALSLYDEEIPDEEGGAYALNILGIIFQKRGDLDRAEANFKKALEKIGDQPGQADFLGNMGLVYAARDDLDRAEDHFKKALVIQKETGNLMGQANALGNLGNVYADRDRPDQAEENYKKALAIQEGIGDLFGQATALGNLGNVYSDRGDLGKAQQNHKQALSIYQMIGDRLGEARQLGNLGILASDKGDIDNARDLLSQATGLFDEIGAGGGGAEIIRNALRGLDDQHRQD